MSRRRDPLEALPGGRCPAGTRVWRPSASPLRNGGWRGTSQTWQGRGGGLYTVYEHLGKPSRRASGGSEVGHGGPLAASGSLRILVVFGPRGRPSLAAVFVWLHAQVRSLPAPWTPNSA